MKPANGLTKAERTKDEAEAKRIRTELRRKYQPSFRVVAPGVRRNSRSKKFEVLVTKFVGSFDTLTAAKKARERFIAKVANVRV